MNLRNVYGVLLQEWYVTKHSLEIFIDVFFFPLVNLAIFGFISLYLSGNNEVEAAQYVLLGMILWQPIWVIEYSVSVGSLWNIWSRNLSNMFVAPLRLKEYISAHFLSGIIKALFLLAVSAGASVVIFRFNPLAVGGPTLALTLSLFSLFAFAVGVAVLGLIFRFGTRIQALSWSVITIFQPLCAAFFPASAMPHALRVLAYCFPPTYGFEAARFALARHEVAWNLFFIGFALDLLYCTAAIVAFKLLFDGSRASGQFARNDA